MKRVLASVMAMLVLETSVFAKTDNLTYSQEENNIKITGKIESGLENKRVKIIVINPRRSIEELENDFENVFYYADEVYTDSEGKYEITVPLNGASESGEYKFYVQDDEGVNPEELLFYYADTDEKINCAQNINGSSKTDIKDFLSDAINTFSLDRTLVSGVIDDVAGLLYEYKESTPITEENAKSVIEELAVIAAFNSGKTELVYDNGEFLNSDIIDFSEIDRNGVTLYNVFSEKIDSKGEKAVIEGLTGQGLKSKEELFKKFAELVFINAIKNPVYEGTGHVEEILTKENAKAVEISVDAYLNIKNNSQKKNTELDLMKENFVTAKELEEKLPTIVSSNKEQSKPSSGGGGSGGSSGAVVITPIENGAVVKTDTSVFADMKGVAWAEEAVNYLYENKIVSGTGNNMFSPQKSVTREQFTVMLINSLGAELIGGNGKFSDVLPGSYYEKHIATGVELGIVNGMDAEIFGTGKTITRQDICTLIYRAYFKDEVSQNTPEFTDVSDISEYAYPAVILLQEKGIVNGFTDGSFRPKEVCTRAQAAKMLYGAIKYIG